MEDELGRARRDNARQAREREALAEDLKKAQAAAHAKGRERDELRSALKQSEKEAGQLERTLAKREKEVESLRADLRVLRADHRCLEARFDEQRAHLEEALQDAAVVPGLQADLEDKDLAEQALRRNRQRNAELEKKLGSSKDRMLVLEEQIEDQAHRIEDLDGKYHEFNEGARMLTHLLRDINLEGEVSLGRLAQVEIVSDIAQPLWQQLRKLLQAHGDLTRRAAALTSATEELDAARRREREHRAERGNLEELAEDERVRRRRAEEQLERLEAKYRLAKASLKDMEGFTGALGLALHKMPSLPEITEDMERLEARWPPKLALILAATAALVRSWKTRRGEALELRARAAEAEARADRATGKAAETCQALVEQTEASLRAMKQTCACKAVREMNRKKKNSGVASTFTSRRRKSSGALGGKFSPVRSGQHWGDDDSTVGCDFCQGHGH